MPEILAFAGKGGVGKTTLSALLVRYLVEHVKGGPVFAVDADPNSNLNELLGTPVRVTIGEARELLKKDVPVGMSKESWVGLKVHEAVIEGDGYDLLVMGRPEGPGCYCAANSLAKKHIDLLKDNYAFVVIDNEAGMEHMSRLVTQDVDHLFVISDGSSRGLMTARRVLDIIAELKLNIRNTYVIVNRVPEGSEDEVTARALRTGIEVSGIVRNDEVMAREDSEGKTIFSLDVQSPALADAYGIFASTLEKKHGYGERATKR